MNHTPDNAHQHQPETPMVNLTIDGIELRVAQGTLIIRAAELIGVDIPRFCDHPLLDPVGACRQCLVEVEGQRKPLTSCTTAVAEGMVVHSQLTSDIADQAQRGVMELLLINHPLDCPVCDKGGECPLQNQAMSAGRTDTRFLGSKRTFPKPISLSAQVLLDRERCILCARCTRFADQIAGDPSIALLERGASQQVGIAHDTAFDSYFSGNTVQICPVGALTSETYRFRARPFDLVSSASVCEHCACGCAQRTDHRRGVVLRRLAGDDPEVNEEWNCDKGRWAFTYATMDDRITTPLVRDSSGKLCSASWSQALELAAHKLANSKTGVLVGGRVTTEDAYAYAKFSRIILGTNDIDCRARAHSAEETHFLAALVAGQPVSVTYADIETAPVVVLAGIDPEEEAPIVFIRLLKAVRKRGMHIISLAPLVSRGSSKLNAHVLITAPGQEATAIDALTDNPLLKQPGSIILIGERLAGSPGALSAVSRLTEHTGARLAWIPRRAGERGAIDAGCLPNLLPGGRPVCNTGGRQDVMATWNSDTLPTHPGRDTGGIIAAACAGELNALLIGGVDPADLEDPAAALAAIQTTPYVVSVECRQSAVTEYADIVFPVAPVAEKSGSFINWEGRYRHFEAALPSYALSDFQVLQALASRLDIDLGLNNQEYIRGEMASLKTLEGQRLSAPAITPNPPPVLRENEAVLAGWRMLLDNGRLQDGEPYLAKTQRLAVVRLSAATAANIGASNGQKVIVSNDYGVLSLPLVITDMADQVVWLPFNSPGSAVYEHLGASEGSIVRIEQDNTL